MPADKRIDARRDFTRRILPWLVAAAMLVFYAVTLNRWVSLINFGTVADISGWLWAPQLKSPLFYLVTLPLRMLPVPAVPIALNLFSAACAAMALGLLARSAGLLPHDRTEAQVVRERNDFSLLTIRSAWFPPLLAVMLCGLQLTFWETATNGGPEMFDLLLFAFVVWSLIEYRLDEREGRLFLSAAIVGAGVVEDQAMMAFFPVFIIAVIWVRGLKFFNWQFLGRMFLCGLGGFLLFLLLPLLAVISDKVSVTFWQALKLSLLPQFSVLKNYFHCVSDPSGSLESLLVPLFITLMPLFVLSIRWKFGDSSRLGSTLASLMFHSIHAIFLGVCIWLVFDPPFSPREKGLGLTLYYVVALSAGYYAGYFLLIFGKKNPRAEEFPPFPARLLDLTIVAGVWVLGILAIAGLFYKNTPLIRAANDDSLRQYASLVVENLPHLGAIALSDEPAELYLTRAELAREGRDKDYLMLDTQWLLYPDYHRYLHKISPQQWPLLISPKQTGLLNRVGMLGMLATLSTSNELCYLHPSFGDYFEKFYLEPHGLIYKLKSLPGDTLLPPPPDENLIAENEKFWIAARMGALKPAEDALAIPDPRTPASLAQKLLARLHIPHEVNFNAMFVGTCSSRSLNFWGVELQRSGDLTDAAARFDMALRLNPDNVAAQTNLCFNGDLQAGRHIGIDPSEVEPVGKFNSLADAIKQDGPFDQPSFCFGYGYILAHDNGFLRQAVAPFERVRQLDPNFLPVRIWLARIYALNHLPDLALDVLRAPMDRPGDFSLTDADYTGINILGAAAYFQKNDFAQGSRLLEMQISRDPTNNDLLINVERVYVGHGMFSNALAIANRGLSLSPNDPSWLFTKGHIDIQLKKYDDAVVALNGVLAIQKDDADALFQRATAYLGSGDLAAARDDYEKLQEIQTNSFQVAFGLGEIAWREHDTNEVIRNYEIFLAYAPTNVTQTQIVIERMRELNQPAGGQ